MKTKLQSSIQQMSINPVSLRKAKIAYKFGLSECNRVRLYDLNILN